jgi:hypothetical protein
MHLKKIDLHNLRHNEVRSFLIRNIEDMWNSETDVQIITGHSKKMKEIVIGILKEYKLDYRIGDVFGLNEGFIQTVI